jgi:hypothetical protein
MTAAARPQATPTRLRHWARGDLWPDLRAVLPAWITARVLVTAGYVLATAVANRLVGEHPEQLRNGLLAWDGTWYRDIAHVGYGDLPLAGVRFFPLFPIIGRLLAVPFGGRSDVVLVLLANGGSLAAAVLLRRLVLAEKSDHHLADRAVWCLTIFPSAFVLVLAYSESLMLVASIAAFGFLRGRRWWWAAAFGLVAALSRPVGVVLIVPALVEALSGWRAAPNAERGASAVAVLAPVAGLAIYLAWVGRAFGNWRLPFTVQDQLRGGVAFPLSRILEGFRQLAGSERYGDGLHLPFLLVLLVLLALTFRYWPLSYGLYAGAILLAAVSAENLNSVERYGMSAFPLLLTLAVVIRAPQVERAVMAVLGGGLVALSSMAWLGAYVP